MKLKPIENVDLEREPASGGTAQRPHPASGGAAQRPHPASGGAAKRPHPEKRAAADRPGRSPHRARELKSGTAAQNLHPERRRASAARPAKSKDAELTIAQALQAARAALSHIDSGSRDALLLLGRAAGLSREAILAYPERKLGAEEEGKFNGLVERRAQGEPLPYLLGEWWFYGRKFTVDPAVLIPRPETEVLVDAALRFLRTRNRLPLRILDVGTGSGIIAISLALDFPDADVLAVDISPEALAVARANAGRHAAGRVRFLESDLLEAVNAPASGFDLIAANLPYIPTPVLAGLEVSRFEPRRALDGGPDGLDEVRRLLAAAPGALAPDGLLLLELEENASAAAAACAADAFPRAAITTAPDLSGRDRLLAVRSGPADGESRP